MKKYVIYIGIMHILNPIYAIAYPLNEQSSYSTVQPLKPLNCDSMDGNEASACILVTNWINEKLNDSPISIRSGDLIYTSNAPSRDIPTGHS